MTEAEWLACGDPRAMLDRVPLTAGERRCRLLACGLLRILYPATDDHPAHVSVDLGERWADGTATEEDVQAFQATDPEANWATLYQPAHDLLRLCADAPLDAWRPVPDLLRDIFGNPFRPVACSPEWRTSTVLALAAQMYESRDFSAMPILADALQDAGCDNADVLDHCRGAGHHVRGCWCVDQILGKE